MQMANLFNQDFIEFIDALNKENVEYILVGGYAVILHGYTRTTADMDVWVNKTTDNYLRLSKAYERFGAPIFSEHEFFEGKNDVWGIGMEPFRIEILNKIKGVSFDEAYNICQSFIQENVAVKYINLKHLLQAKEAAGRYKDKDDIEQLTKSKG